jgi:hypothetical protein
VSDAWMPGVGHLRAAGDGGHLRGGAPRVVWQALGADPAIVSAKSAAERLSDLGRASHLIWNPLNGEIIQLVSILRAGRSLGGPDGLGPFMGGCAGDPGARQCPAEPANDDRLADVNCEGRLCVQLGVVAFSWEPFTAGPMTGLRGILDWLDSWGIARHWPAGPPAAHPRAQPARASRRLWASGGHFGASQVPGCATAGPGGIDIERLTGQAAPPAIQRPAAAARRRDRREGGLRGSEQREREQRERELRERDLRARDERTRRDDSPGGRGRLADLDEIFEHPATTGSLTRVG